MNSPAATRLQSGGENYLQITGKNGAKSEATKRANLRTFHRLETISFEKVEDEREKKARKKKYCVNPMRKYPRSAFIMRARIDRISVMRTN